MTSCVVAVYILGWGAEINEAGPAALLTRRFVSVVLKMAKEVSDLMDKTSHNILYFQEEHDLRMSEASSC